MFRHSFVRFALLVLLGAAVEIPLRADPLSKKITVDFFRQVPSRDLHGLATRSDGRLVSGPVVTDLQGAAPAELLWSLEPFGPGRWLVGTGPEGRIFEVDVDYARGRYDSREFGRLNGGHVFAVRRLPDGGVLAGSSPRGELALLRDGKIQARIGLPADSIFDLAVIPPAGQGGRGAIALAATGNPAAIYRIDLAKFAAGGDVPERVKSATELAAHGITLFGRVRDRNVRRIAVLADGRIAAGSSPKGNVYVFPAPRPVPPAGSGPEASPLILDENRNAEVTDLLPRPNGDFLASLVTNGGEEFQPTMDKAKDRSDVPPRAEIPSFSGRGVLGRFPAGGFPEALLSRAGSAFYHLALHGDLVLIAGGEAGDFTGYDLRKRMALTFAGSQSARLNDIEPVPGQAGRFLLLRNNAPGLALADFGGSGRREAETGRVDLGIPSRIGAVRFGRLRHLDPARLQVEIRTSNGSDELEGWSDWVPLRSSGDGWRAPGLRGRYLKLRLRIPAEANAAEIDRASVYFLPQDRPPELAEFHFISPNYAIIPQPEPVPSATATLSQLLQGRDEDKRKSNFLSSEVVPSPGTEVAFWTVNDPDGDNLVYTFSIRRDGDPKWTDLAIDSRDSFVQFDTSHLPDGVYFTRLVAREAAPRPPEERLSVTYETDDLVVDHTAPVILSASVERRGDFLVVRVHGRDALSLLGGISADFNNGDHAEVEQPVDGILDGREESFAIEEPVARTTRATAVDVTLYDDAGNSATRHLPLPR